ncbi:unnamed protein product [Clonostachys chloroleuca]|uniref:HPt domain-containing protein n=1 Tax=Clonostachys chloroleuca TaxID=1926264 RepID=A0AA35M2I2_9HYPO|nr:unnamed protein product [Clonostachys chloroleuca]
MSGNDVRPMFPSSFISPLMCADYFEDNLGIPPDAQDFVDIETFKEILKLDDEGPERKFSKELAFSFFEQAENTFDEIDHSLEEEELENLSALGCLFKGSAAALGIYKVRDACEKIQCWGASWEQSGFEHVEREDSLKKIRDILPILKVDYKAAKDWLINFLGHGD